MRVHVPLAGLALATVASIGGTRLSAIAIPWLVLTTTGSAVMTGAVALAEMLPYVVAKALSGPLIDRVGARRLSTWSDWASMLAVALLPLMYWAGWFDVWVLLPAVAVIGVLRAPSDAAKQALIPSVARDGALPMERVTGILGASERLASALGAAGAGALIALVGPIPALLANAVAFGLGAAVLGVSMPRAAVTPGPTKDSYLTQFSAGWAALRQDQVLCSLVIMVAITNLLDQAYAVVLLPVWVQEHGLDAGWLGLAFAIFSLASIAGSALAAAIGERLPRLQVYTIAFLITGLPRFAVFALDAPTAIIMTTLVVGGFSAGFLNPIISAIMFERIPAELVGRVIALIGALTWVLIPFGGIYAGVLTSGFGVQVALWVSGAFYLLATLSPVLIPSFRQMNRPRVAEAGSRRA